ncbi:AarF/UbiB family protein [Acidovorax sp. Be4]|uniref:AarF/UbiB family protein n=1 Tax=Acidovorax bellezanensis TaxID=2976702 RepID=A0ABT2PII3_9BURK|nr:AarF/UbiB family protein [Acidovorax sp. Be4]MCT9809599.1 AarF/UbiB family protein [Acidovorax sp. Be4]
MAMLYTGIVAVRDRARLQEIVGILLKFGLADVVQVLGLSRWAPWRTAGEDGDAQTQASRPERVRMAIEALGPTFVKLGQILATRSDLLPAEWTQALEQLHQQAAALPWDVMQAHIEAQLGMPIEQAFSHFDKEPLAAASIAQVYRASVLRDDGTPREVVVKVQRPGIRAGLEADVRLLKHVALMAQENFAQLERYRPVEMAQQVSEALRDELDFTIEGQHNDLVADAFAQQPDIVIARIVWELSGPELLVQDLLAGVPAHQVPLHPELDGPLLARRGAQAFLQMVLRDGLFHADPHPGNLLAMSDNRVGFIDFGLVGHLSERRRDQFLVLLRAMVESDANGLVMVLLEWTGDAQADIALLESAVERYVAKRNDKPLSLGASMMEFMGLAREAQVAMPADMALLFKALITADRVLLQLDPEFDVVRIAQPMVEAQIRARYAPERLLREQRAAMVQLYEMAADAPKTLRLLMYRLKQGRVGVDMNIRHLQRVSLAVERAATRMALAVVAGAFILGMGPTLLAWDVRWFGVPVFPVLGGLGAVVSLAVLALTMRRQKALE